MLRNHNKISFVLLAVVIILFAVLVLNIKVTSYQGKDYQLSILKVPLFLKIMDFFNRHYHYKLTAEEIVQEARTEEEKVLRIFYWTHKNIKKPPPGFPIIDDHVYNIIIRGYGTDDQSADVMATLCTYVGLPAAWIKIRPRDSQVWHGVTVVNIQGRKLLLDPYFGNYFRNKEGKIASIDDIIWDPSLVEKAKFKPLFRGVEYVKYFEDLKPIGKSISIKENQQMPLPRLNYELKKWLGFTK